MELINDYFSQEIETVCYSEVTYCGDTVCNVINGVFCIDSSPWLSDEETSDLKCTLKPSPNIFKPRDRDLNTKDLNGFAPIHFPLTSYSTDSRTGAKEEMKHVYGDTLFFNNLHLIPDPLKKNLADSVITGEEKRETDMVETKEPERPQRPDYYPSLAGITSFFSGVLNVMGAIFQKRTTSKTSQYYDCFEDFNDQQMAPSPWQSSNIEVQNKSERDMFIFASNNELNTNLNAEMSADCRLAASHCEEKLNKVQLLLTNKKNIINEQPSKFRLNGPRKAFIEAGSVEESFEDAFSPEDVTSLANDTYVEYYSPYNHHNEKYIHAEAPKLRTEMCVKEPMGVVHNLPVENNQKKNLNENTVINDNSFVSTEDIVSSCEDKLSKLKALLKLKSKQVVSDNNEPEVTHKPEITNPIPIPVHDSAKSESRKDVPNETVFGTEINSTELHSSQDSDYFNEVTGKFFSSSLESDDSFQIVFSDSPPNCRRRIPSECDSEDSFIVFEESPDSCYTSQDIFGEDVDVNHSDSDSDIEEDSGITCKLAHNLSRTFSDLTDDSLYSQDVVDSVQVRNEIFDSKVNETAVVEDESIEEKKSGLLLSEKRKLEKQKLPPKKVTFSSQPPKVHVMRVWAFAARQARAGHWERHARDRERFKRRIADVEMAISWVFKRQHRTRIVFQRFRPWWNAERRRELAEKKEEEEREKERKQDEEREKVLKEEETSALSETEDFDDNTDLGTGIVSKDDVGDCNEKLVHNGIDTVDVKLNGFIEAYDKVETKQAMEYNVIEKIDDSNPNYKSDKLNVFNKPEIEISKSIKTVSDDDIPFKQYRDHSNIKTTNSKIIELHKDTIEETPGVKESIKVAITDDKLIEKFQGLHIKDASVDT